MLLRSLTETMFWEEYRSKYNLNWKTQRKLNFTAEVLDSVAKQILDGETGIRGATKELGIGKSTL